jgi:hypothetical protein
MKIDINKWDIIKKIIVIFILSLLISLSIGIFLFDKNVLVYKQMIQDKISIYSSCKNFLPLVRYSSLCFIGISLILLFFGFLLRSKKALAYTECLRMQTMSFVPLIFLAFGRFFYGKAVNYIFILPLFPIFLSIILAAVVHLNLILYFDFNVFRSCSEYLKRHFHIRKKIYLIFTILILSSLLIHIFVQNPHFQRFSSHRYFLGDEPKYLRMAYSLATDRDLDVSDEFVIEEGLEAAKERILKTGSRIFGHLSIIGLDGKIYHLHMPGLSMFILPGLLLDLTCYPIEIEPSQPYINFQQFPIKLFFTRLWLLTIGILSFLLLARLIYHFFNSLFLLAILLLLFILSSPVPGFVFQLYPELLAFFLILLVLNSILFPFKIKYLSELFIVLGIGFFPWLHQRFLLLTLSLYLAFFINEAIFRKNLKKTLILTFLLFLTSLPYFYYFYSITGNLMPNSMHKFYGETFSRLAMFPLGFFGHLFDDTRGMIWIYPWTTLALIGIYWGIKFDKKRIMLLLILFVPYYFSVCFHPAWHGMTEEPGRYIVAIFSLMLLFLGYSLKTFFKRPTYPQMFLYVSILIIILLNKKFLFFIPDFGGSYVTPYHINQMFKCGFFVVFVCCLVALVNRLEKRKWSLISWKHPFLSIKNLYIETKCSFPSIIVRKYISFLLLVFLATYVGVYFKNWNNKMMSTPLLASINKIKVSKNLRLIRKENPKEITEKTDKTFVQLFKNTYSFLIEPPLSKAHIRLGNPTFLEKIPKGCYEVKIKIDNYFNRNMIITLDFMEKTRQLNFKKAEKGITASMTFFLFKDRYISTDLHLMINGQESKNISGTLEICPLSCLTYGKDLILRPRPKENPKPIKKVGKNRYRLFFIMNAAEVKKKIKFFLFTKTYPDIFNRKNETLIASKEEWISKKKSPIRVNMRFRLPSDFQDEKSGLVLLATDENNHLLRCQSLWLNTQKTYWNFLKRPISSSNNIIFGF